MALRTYADGSLFGERFGTETPQVLAMHGWGRSRADFSEVLRGLDAISLDLPGFGASPPPPDVWGAMEYAAAIAPVVAELATPAVLVGHSFGGRVATTFAAHHPDLVRGLVLVGVPLLHRSDRNAATPDFTYRVIRWLHRRGLIGDDRIEAEKRKRGSADYRAATGVMRDVLVKAVNETYEDAMSAVQCPVRLVWGENDDEVPVSVAERSQEIFLQASLDVVAEVGHHVPLNAPDRIRAAVEVFL